MTATIEKYLQKQKLNKDIFHGRAVMAFALSLAVIIGVFWWLKLVGITMAGDAFCGIPEHRHSQQCTQERCICGLEEDADHVHTDACYEIAYSCGLQEHIHTASCYSDTRADVENAVAWEKTLASVQQTADFGANLLSVAQSQLGYAESTRNFQVGDDGVRRGYTRYGDWYGNPYGDWSGMFVGFCLHYAGVSHEDLPYYAGVETMRLNWQELGVYAAAQECSWQIGDVVFLDHNGDGRADTAAILAQVGNGTVTLIAGDYEDKVGVLTLPMQDPSILGGTVRRQLLLQLAGPQDLERIREVTSLIAELPSMDTIGRTLGAYESLGDMDGYAAYFTEMAQRSRDTYARWEDIGIFRSLVENGQDLLYYQSMWVMEADASFKVYNINKYGTPNVLVYGSSTQTVQSVMGASMSFAYWNAYTVSYDAISGYYYVSAINTSSTSKLGTKLPGTGFVFLVWRQDSANVKWDVKVGDRIEVPFHYKRGSVSNTSGYGTLSHVKNNSLKPIQSADTKELIEVNLYNYGNKINSMYNSNKNYPGFQQEYGTTIIYAAGLSSGSFNFGNNITSDLDAGITGITNKGGAINTTVNRANTPITGAMNYNLVNGYPALAYTASGFDPSLKWLFSNNAATSTTKVNTDNINGLFQQDPVTGKYYFDSRLTHAQYNAQTGNFDLFSEALTPNFMMYPFGNFMPFNDINAQTTKVTSINRSYYTSMASAALVKYNNGLGDEYKTLSDAMTTFVSKMGTSFTYLDTVEKYFSLAGIPSGGSAGAAIFNDMYNLDYDDPADFYFGMDMHMNFIMPKNGTTGPNGDVPLSFDFNGDDDVWVYVDGKLFLDLSGIHRHVGGRIDFQNGRVEYYQMNPQTGEADISVNTNLKDANGNDYSYIKVLDDGTQKTIYYVPFSVLLGDKAQSLLDPNTGTFYTYSNHSFDFYYMERGSGSSVCKMEFNLPLLEKNSISVTKELQSEDDLSDMGDPDFLFQVLKEDGVTPLIAEGVEYTIMDADNMVVIGSGVTGVGGVFTLKAGQTAVLPGITENEGRYFVRELLDPEVFDQYGMVTVKGSSTTISRNVQVGSSTFIGVDSDLKDISDGSTNFVFTNHIDKHQYGSLKLYKHYLDYQSGLEPKDVTFLLAFGGEPITEGSTYKVILADGSVEIRTVTAAGQITFRSDETIWFPKLLAGTVVTVREAAESSAGYDVTYGGQGFTFTTMTDATGLYGQGQILAGQGGTVQAEIVVSNDREGTKLPVPVQKILLHPDGVEHSYSFVLQKVVSPTDLTPDGMFIRAPITIEQGVQDFVFTLNFPPGTPDGKHYYLVYEENVQAGNGMDPARYLLEVTTTATGGTVSAQITGRYNADGTEITGTDPLTFTNRVVRSLTISKSIIVVQPTDAQFLFTIQASVDGLPLTGTYPCIGADGVTEVTFVDGKATVKLKHGQSATVQGLPYGSQWTVTETSAGGYFPSHQLNDGAVTAGNAVTGVLEENSTVAFYNAGGYELPSTGSAAHLVYIIAGSMLMLLSLIAAYTLRRRRERRNS